ncbi:MAG TPA: hypothetical protein PLY87_13510, partial [Planctomycetaceae bacterium]|nr:hypothetical protein [Planctomycetaceae bacterium]
DEMAIAVDKETEAFRPNFRPNPSCPTEAHYRGYMLLKACRDCYGLRHFLLPEKGSGFTGIMYGDCIKRHQRIDSRKWFIHGLLGPQRVGSCTSLPMLYAEVGRRLGYPIKLVPSLCHIFVRWEDGSERFNLEGTSPDYINCHPDEYYIDTPKPWTDRQKTCGYFLKSANARETLAIMLATRSMVLMFSGRLLEAGMMNSKAIELAPGDPEYPNIGGHIEKQLAELPEDERVPALYSSVLNIGFDGKRFYIPDQRLQLKVELLKYETPEKVAGVLAYM